MHSFRSLFDQRTGVNGVQKVTMFEDNSAGILVMTPAFFCKSVGNAELEKTADLLHLQYCCSESSMWVAGVEKSALTH